MTRRKLDIHPLEEYARPMQIGLGCGVPKCKKVHAAMNLCETHYSTLNAWRLYNRLGRLSGKYESLKKTKSCKVDGCNNPYKSKNLCANHYAKVWRKSKRQQ